MSRLDKIADACAALDGRIDALAKRRADADAFKPGQYVVHESTGRAGKVIESNQDGTLIKLNGSEKTVSVPTAKLRLMAK